MELLHQRDFSEYLQDKFWSKNEDVIPVSTYKICFGKWWLLKHPVYLELCETKILFTEVILNK